MRALRIAIDGTLQSITLDDAGSLDSMQQAIGGNVEHIAAVPGAVRGDEISVYADAEGRLRGLPVSCLLETEESGTYFDLCGPVLIMGANRRGESRGLSEVELASVRVLTRDGCTPVLQLPGLSESLPALAGARVG